MTYKKGEIRVLGDAAVVIRNLQKTEMVGQDQKDLSNPFATDPAYDLDE